MNIGQKTGIRALLVLVCIGVCIDVGPSNAAERAWILAAKAAVAAPICALHPPLIAPKAVLSSSILLVKCPLIARGKLKPELEFHAGTRYQLVARRRKGGTAVLIRLSNECRNEIGKSCGTVPVRLMRET